MVAAILQAAGRRPPPPATSAGRWLDVVSRPASTTCSPSSCPASSCTTRRRVRPAAGVVLNVAEDHLDWHGSMAAYAADKARVLSGAIAVAVVDDPAAAALLAAAPARQRVGVTGGPADPVSSGCSTGCWWTRRSAPVRCCRSADGPAGRAAQRHQRAGRRRRHPGDRTRPARDVAAGLRTLRAGRAPQRAGRPGRRGAIRRRFQGHQPARRDGLAVRPPVGGVDRRRPAQGRLDRRTGAWPSRPGCGAWCCSAPTVPVIERALARHAPEVPRRTVAATDDGAMTEVVRAAAAAMARPGDAVLLAPAAASLDMYSSYAARGEAFAAAVAAAASGTGPPVTTTGERSTDQAGKGREGGRQSGQQAKPEPVGPRLRLVRCGGATEGLARPADDVVPPGGGGVRAAARVRPADGAVVLVGHRLPQGRLVLQRLQEA